MQFILSILREPLHVSGVSRPIIGGSNPTRTSQSVIQKEYVSTVVCIRLYLLMLGLDTPETCNGWRNTPRIIFLYNQLDAQVFFVSVYFYSLHVSGSHVPIIRRIASIHLVFFILYTWPFGVQVWSLIQTCTPNGHLYTVTYTRCRIDTINSPDDGHVAARNM